MKLEDISKNEMYETIVDLLLFIRHHCIHDEEHPAVKHARAILVKATTVENKESTKRFPSYNTLFNTGEYLYPSHTMDAKVVFYTRWDSADWQHRPVLNYQMVWC